MGNQLVSRLNENPLEWIQGTASAGGLDIRFRGQRCGNELIFYHPASARGQHVLQAWIAHLSAAVSGLDLQTVFFFRDSVIRFDEIAEQFIDYLTDLVDLFKAGQTRPIPFFCESAFTYVTALNAPKGKQEKALDKARGVFEDAYKHKGEGSDIYIKTAFFEQEPMSKPLVEEFTNLANLVFAPVFNYMKETE